MFSLFVEDCLENLAEGVPDFDEEGVVLELFWLVVEAGVELFHDEEFVGDTLAVVNLKLKQVAPFENLCLHLHFFAYL